MASIQSTPELAHETKIQLIIVLVFRLKDEVKVTKDEPFLIVVGSSGDDFGKKSSFICVNARAIYWGEEKRGAALTDGDLGGDQKAANVNVCNRDLIFIPEKNNTTSCANSCLVSERSELKTTNVGRSLLIYEIKFGLLKTRDMAGSV